MGRYWAYFDAKGERITDRAEIDRLNAIGLPPAYKDAWFCTDSNGHLQATGVDARGRKQYRYHVLFREKQDSAKFDGLLEFGKALPRLRRRVARDLKRRELCIVAVCAASRQERQLHSHLHGALNAGASPREVDGALDAVDDLFDDTWRRAVRHLWARIRERGKERG